ncbi:hypothetical protein GLYMA_02G162651v4 [Glycine max]|nr:hypothetical protein GLYMA_02G162651v4 [Glycine max]KAG5080273.1 hypothetical protein JHK86_004338 [Glycine max]KAH1060643.1 hypothetical protein GYH30_004214 [Glycine max]
MMLVLLLWPKTLCSVMYYLFRIFDCNPMIFAADEREIWSFVRYLGERKAASSGPRYGSQDEGDTILEGCRHPCVEPQD